MKKKGAREIVPRRKMTIMSRKVKSCTETDTDTIYILYGCLIPLGLSNRTPPRTEPWLGWGGKPGKIYGRAFKGVLYNESLVQKNKDYGDGRSF